MTGSNTRSDRRVLILGLDGADWSVIDPLLHSGRLPAMAALLADGSRAPLASTVPPISAAAWVSFLLGADPGSHGILDFRATDARRYEGTTGHVVTAADYPKRTLFDVAGSAGLRVASVRVPMTFPAWPLNGVMVAGPPTPDERRLYTEPEDLASTLAVGELDIGNRVLEYPLERQVEILRMQLQRSQELGQRVIAAESFDLTMVAVNTPDNAHHCFWHLRDGTGDDWVDRFYQDVDTFVGTMVSLREWDLVVVLSDHGGGPRAFERVSVNAWLAGLGALRPRDGYRTRLSSVAAAAKRRRKLVRLVRRWAPTAVQRRVSGVTQFTGSIEWSGTTAFGVHLFHPYFGIEINVRGRQPLGVVEPEDLERTRDALIRSLSASAKERSLPVREVLTREQVWGPAADDRLPDIVVRFEDRAEGANDVSGPLLTPVPAPGPHETKSYHSPHGILVLKGAGVRSGRFENARLCDVAPTVLSYLGVRPPPEMTGRVLTEMFDPGTLPTELTDSGPVFHEPAGSRAITDREEREIVAALQGLGYLE